MVKSVDGGGGGSAEMCDTQKGEDKIYLVGYGMLILFMAKSLVIVGKGYRPM